MSVHSFSSRERNRVSRNSQVKPGHCIWAYEYTLWYSSLDFEESTDAVVQFFILGGNQGAAKPSIGWVRAKGGDTLVWWPRMTPLYNNYWTIGTPSLVNSLPNIETWWIMDAIGVSSMTNPLDKALWANLVCTEKLSFSRDAAGRGWKIHKPWVSSILMKMELSIFLSQQGNISRCMQMWCEILLDSSHLGSWSHLWGRWI